MRLSVEAGLFSLITACILSGCNQEPRRSPDITAPASRSAVTADERFRTGERLFKQYCSPCHPDGGNVTEPHRTLRGSDLKANNINSPVDIVRIMRNPKPRMIRFDVETISDGDAMAIAECILTKFKN